MSRRGHRAASLPYNAAMISEQVQAGDLTFSGKRFDVRTLAEQGRDGQAHRRDVVVHPGAVVIVPLLDDSTVLLIRNARVAVGETLWELPAGTLEPPEPPETCAGRELLEETGYRAAEVSRLTSFYTSPGICTERMYAFVARGLTHEGQQLEASEFIEVHPTPLDDAMAMVRDERIRDGKTVAALLYFQAFARTEGRA